ncbi:hypothetical protein [Sulfitobacter aestuariivivens]|uniref:hypothetical protein n=1 Tax=Sulfitobacter aestuariivivens TaxID=2766981 RepID=UPI0036105EFD
MVTAVFTVEGSLSSSPNDGLVGLDDLHLVHGAGGTVLYAVSRGGGYLTGFDVGDAPGQTVEGSYWSLAAQFLQLETTDLVLRDHATGPQLYMAGLNSGACAACALMMMAQVR